MQFYYLLLVRQVKINKEEKNKLIFLNEKINIIDNRIRTSVLMLDLTYSFTATWLFNLAVVAF